MIRHGCSIQKPWRHASTIPGWVQAIQDVMDLIATPGAYPADQINADPGTTAFQQFLAGTGAMLNWWGDVGSNARTSDSSVVGDVVGFDINPGTERVYNAMAGAWEDTPNVSPNNAYIGWGIYVTNRVEGDDLKRKAAWSAAAHLGGKDLSLWASAYPSGFQPYRNSHFQFDEWEAAGYDRPFVEDYLGSNLDSYNHPNAAIEPRIPGIFQYYSVAEDELAKGFAGEYGSAQETADAIAAAWETDHRPNRAREPNRALQEPPSAFSGQLAGLAGAPIGAMCVRRSALLPLRACTG
jgi:multiple sugar transport system substrate-binding protein